MRPTGGFWDSVGFAFGTFGVGSLLGGDGFLDIAIIALIPLLSFSSLSLAYPRLCDDDIKS